MRFGVMVGICWLGACSGSENCPLEGTYTGSFSGDHGGDAELVVTSLAEAAGTVEIRLVGSTLEVSGDGSIDCTTGSFVLPLDDASGQQVGDALGSVGTVNGSGEWTLFAGPLGVWQY